MSEIEIVVDVYNKLRPYYDEEDWNSEFEWLEIPMRFVFYNNLTDDSESGEYILPSDEVAKFNFRTTFESEEKSAPSEEGHSRSKLRLYFVPLFDNYDFISGSGPALVTIHGKEIIDEEVNGKYNESFTLNWTKYDYYPFDVRKPQKEYDPDITPDRKFGNDDIIIRYYDGRMLNLKYTQSNSIAMESDITSHTTSIDRLIDKSGDDYEEIVDKEIVNKDLKTISVNLILGDVWGKDSNGGIVKYINRNEALRRIDHICRNNVIFMFESDIGVFYHCIMEEYNVNQTSESDNTYQMDCTIREVNIIDELPKFHLLADDFGEEYEERPYEDDLIEYPLTRRDEGAYDVDELPPQETRFRKWLEEKAEPVDERLRDIFIPG